MATRLVARAGSAACANAPDSAALRMAESSGSESCPIFPRFTLDHRLLRRKLGTLARCDQRVVEQGLGALLALDDSPVGV